jgi:hypothetical protein
MVNDFQVPNITFTDINGKTYTIKDIRPIVPAASSFSVDKRADELLDSIAVRPEVFGDGGEDKVYKLFDQNSVAIVDANFDLTQIRKVRIPIE